MDDRKVEGKCPMGCGETLFLGDGGGITCSFVECPNPTAASDVLTSVRGVEVVVQAIERHDEQQRAQALEAALTPYERALIDLGIREGQNEVETAVNKVIGRGALTLDANLVRAALSEGRSFVGRSRTNPHLYPPDDRVLRVVMGARRQADREEAEARGCKIDMFSSSVCALGTKGCNVADDNHLAAGIAEAIGK